MDESIPTPTAQATVDSAEVPGYKLPAIPGGAWQRVLYPQCQGCQWSGAHKGFQGYYNDGTLRNLVTASAKSVNERRELLRRLQGFALLCSLITPGLVELNNVAQLPSVSTYGPWPVTGVGSNEIELDWSNGPDPRHLAYQTFSENPDYVEGDPAHPKYLTHGNAFSLDGPCVGILTLENSELSGYEWIFYNPVIDEDLWTITLKTANPIGGIAESKPLGPNGNVMPGDVLAYLKLYTGAAFEQWAQINDLFPTFDTEGHYTGPDPAKPAPSNPLAAVSQILYGIPFKYEQMQTFNPDSFAFSRHGAPSLSSLCGLDLVAAGALFAQKAWNVGTGGWGRIIHIPQAGGALMADQTRGFNKLITLDDGSAPDFESPASYGPGARGDGVTMNDQNAGANDENDAQGSFRAASTNGLMSVHKYTGAVAGTPGRCVRFRPTVLVFTQIANAAGAQEYGDGTISVGNFGAHGEDLDAGNAGIVGHTKLQLPKCGLKSRKDAGVNGGDETVMVVTVQEVITNPNGSLTLALTHRAETFARAAGTGNEDTQESRYCGGLNVLPEEPIRLTNWMASTAVIGAGKGIESGCCLLLDNAAAPAAVMGHRVRIISARACDQDFSIVSNNWQGDWTGIPGLWPEFETEGHADNCDTITIVDDGDGVLSAVSSLLAGRQWTVARNALAMPGATFVKSGPSTTDSAVAPVKSYPASGLYIFADSLAGSCLVANVSQVTLESLPSCPGDFAPLVEIAKNILRGEVES